jgi:acetaldehyde dehydrogenase (acetylating)
LANPEVVGKGARFIAEKAGVNVPPSTRVLVAELDGVGRDHPLSIEKLSPILAFYVVKDWREGCERSRQVLAYGGMGHTLSIHSQNQDIIMEFALQKPAFRIVVNSPATHGAVGFSTGLDPAMTLGCGAYGGNITSDNITPMHLINIKRLAFGLTPVDLKKARIDYGFDDEVRGLGERSGLRGSVADEVSRFLDRRGFPESSNARDASDVGRKNTDPVSHLEGEDEPSQPARSESCSRAEAPAPLDFISEEDVIAALDQGRKLPVDSKTVITPSARDLGNQNSIFIRV